MAFVVGALVQVMALPVSAAEPTGTRAPAGAVPASGQPPNDFKLTVPTAEGKAVLSNKLAAAASVGVSAGSLTSAAVTSSPVTLFTFARQQATSYYCGPASGQVVSNYSWGINNAGTGGTTTANNKYTQATIAGWMGTTTAGTSGANLAGVWSSTPSQRTGLNKAANLPSGFGYFYTATGTGAQWHSKVITDISTWAMPLVVPVKPHDPGATYRLTSWPNAIQAWHWIMVRGYQGSWDGTRNPLVFYNDSSGGYSGSTGAFNDPSLDVHYVNALNTGNLVW